MPLEILIVGAGAVGAFYASRLAQSSEVRVSVVCRSNFSAVKSNGFLIDSPQFGTTRFIPHKIFPSPEAAREYAETWDYLVVSTKALPDVSDDSALLEGLVGSGSAIVLIQNGIGVEAPYAKRFPQTVILSAVTIVAAAQPEHGLIKHNRWTRISIGPYVAISQEMKPTVNEGRSRNAKFVTLLKEGGIKDAEEYSHAKLQMVRWHKVAINAAMNPSSVLSGGSSNAAMALDAEMNAHLKGLMNEVLTTAVKIMKVPFPEDLATSDAILKSTMKNTSGSKPSMQIDWEQGKPMELEVILGNPIRIAREHGLEMPRLQSLYAILKMSQTNRDALQQPSRL